MSRKDMAWVRTGKKTPVKLSDWDKKMLKEKVEAEIEKTSKIKGAVSRIAIKAGRIYLFSLYEPSITEGVIFTVPLIDGKYLELIFARITLYDKTYKTCTLDWQRYNNEWMTIDEGSLEDCIRIAEQSDWFQI
jgi:hypothetical protein